MELFPPLLGEEQEYSCNRRDIKSCISEAYITLEDKSVTSLVAIATEKTPTLLGVTTLELLGLTVDPVTGKLTPLELMIL